MFEDLIIEIREAKKDCPYCNSIVVVHYGLEEYRNDHGKGPIYEYDQRSCCMQCGKLWTISYDNKMNILKIEDGGYTRV